MSLKKGAAPCTRPTPCLARTWSRPPKHAATSTCRCSRATVDPRSARSMSLMRCSAFMP
ncbi:hypothetical protein BC831DRAFT_456886 [Entophlyctis helioformis]|nr:hypothetical protein BC831DRAFT_456886 [Entophlyctis helioformis]